MDFISDAEFQSMENLLAILAQESEPNEMAAILHLHGCLQAIYDDQLLARASLNRLQFIQSQIRPKSS